VFYPDKRPTQQIGIVPDITVLPTISDVRDGRDEVLEQALRVIHSRRMSADPFALNMSVTASCKSKSRSGAG
jgi:C-terminal processing protease CtpA/Prc